MALSDGRKLQRVTVIKTTKNKRRGRDRTNIPGQNIPGQNIPGQNAPEQNVSGQYIPNKIYRTKGTRTKHSGQCLPDIIYQTEYTRQNIPNKRYLSKYTYLLKTNQTLDVRRQGQGYDQGRIGNRRVAESSYGRLCPSIF